jgi:predicted nucleic acid-binding protein
MKSAPTLIDTGPLVALLNSHEAAHAWVTGRLGEIEAPVLTCEAVLAEASYLLRKIDRGGAALMGLLAREAVRLAFRLDEHHGPVSHLMARYANVPMSLADACLVRMSEIYESSVVLTLDRDFRVYRRHGRQVVPTSMPPSG